MKNIKELESIFTPKQIAVLKEIIMHGSWGDTTEEFNGTMYNAFIYCTNNIHVHTELSPKEYSGVCSGISKTITSSGTNLIKYVTNYWGDNSGDVIMLNEMLLDLDNKHIWLLGD